jgi:methylase of polypeptide subunit release factors
MERLGDIVGFIYEDLIPDEERHRLGQFYTPRPVAELIVKWAVRGPDDKVLDPGCGSGTFLVEAYKRLAELKLKKPFKEIKHVPSDVHKQILRQLYAIDINEFPAHLTSINLAMKSVRVPSPETSIFVMDYFTVVPRQELMAPYIVRTPEGEKPARVAFADFDVIVGNPPYTRWTEIPEGTRNQIRAKLGDLISVYNLTPQVERGVEPGIYVYWIMHSTGFLKEGGRLGMIISDAWLQTDYGLQFFRYMLDHYRVYAVIDISARVFPVPLIGTSIVLLERSSDKSARDNKRVVLAYLDVSRGSIDVDEILRFIEEVRGNAQPGQLVAKELASGARMMARAYVQGELFGYEGRILNLIFRPEELLGRVKESPLIVELTRYFEPSRGNTTWSIWAMRHGRRPDVGGEEFFYLTEERARQLSIPREFLHPLLPSSRHMRFFTFTRDDWEELRRRGLECYLFLCRRPRNEFPENIRRYIELGEGPNAQIRLRRRPGEPEGRPVSESQASRTRAEHRNIFIDWYDVGGVVEAPIYATYGAQYWVRFVLARFQCALDHRILALIPRQVIQFDEVELKALLAYLNSSFTQLQAETMGRSTGGGMIELDVRPLSSLLILDVKKLPRGAVERLAQLFDKLESEARRLGGADSVENIYGLELARELTGRTDVRPGVQGLFNTVIREVDYEVARILGLESLVEPIRALVLAMAGRRLVRAQEARREAIVGEEREVELRGRRVRGRAGGEGGSRVVRRLDEFLQGS